MCQCCWRKKKTKSPLAATTTFPLAHAPISAPEPLSAPDLPMFKDSVPAPQLSAAPSPVSASEPTSQLPWGENWELDKIFFENMNAWKDESNSTLRDVFEQVNSAISTFKPFLEFIPDSPFPARSLVKGLACLLELGTRIAIAKDDILTFSRQVIEWVESMEEKYRGVGGKFIQRADENLRPLRNLINEILVWGWKILESGMWVIVKGGNVKDDIKDFKDKLIQVGMRVTISEGLNTAHGIDEILQEIREARRATSDCIQKEKAAQEQRQYVQEQFEKSTLANTTYKDQGKHPCDPNTRVEILATINRWAVDVSEDSQNFFWLTGEPGSGKSAIAASLARECTLRKTVLAQYFISRNDPATTIPHVYFPSIARQLANQCADETLPKIYENLKQDPSLPRRMDADQARKLFVEVIQVACDRDRRKPITILIDALDETDRTHLRDTAFIFSGLFNDIRRPNAKIFISSRTDSEITRPFFASLQINGNVKRLHLDAKTSKNDVSKYLRRNIEALIEGRWKWEVWPGKARFDTLCDRAGGLFIWAVTALRFLEEQLEDNGREGLDVLLDALNDEGMDDVDKLFEEILKTTLKANTRSKDNDWSYERFRWVVGFIVALKEALPVKDLSVLLDLRRRRESDPVDVLNFVTKFRTVLVSGPGEITEETIPRAHKSFVDYITERADPHFRINLIDANGKIAMKCLQLVCKLRNTARTSSPSASVRYATLNWTRHLPGGRITSGVAIVNSDAAKLSKSLLSSAVMGFLSGAGDYREHMFGPATGLPPPLPTRPQFTNTSTITGVHVKAISVSSDGGFIATAKFDGTVQIFDASSYRPIGEPIRQPGSIECVSFSSDSRWLLCGSNHLVYVWDCETRESIGTPLLGHNSCVWSICTDGQRIISGSQDGTICVWNLDARKLIGSPIMAGGCVYDVALKNNRVAAAMGNAVRVWDVETRQQIHSMSENGVLVVAFSPDGTRLAFGSSAWDAETGKRLVQFSRGSGFLESFLPSSPSFSSPLSLDFSPDPKGQWIVAGFRTVVRIYASNTGEIIDSLHVYPSIVNFATFFPDGRRIVSGNNETIRIWTKYWPERSQKNKITTIRLSHQASSPSDPPPSVVSACYSPDRTLYAASTLSGHVSIWNSKPELIWETDTNIGPIHLLRLFETRLVISSPIGHTLSWNLKNWRPTRKEPIIRITRADITSIPQFTASANVNILHWIPFEVNAGLWAYVDGCFICFAEGDPKSATIFEVGELGTLTRRDKVTPR